MKNNCGNCHYFLLGQDKTHIQGACRLNPPYPFPIQTLDAIQQPQMSVVSLLPQVKFGEWCGQWTVKHN